MEGKHQSLKGHLKRRISDFEPKETIMIELPESFSPVTAKPA